MLRFVKTPSSFISHTLTSKRLLMVFEKSNILSKTSLNIYMLDFFYQTTLLKRFLNFIEPNLNVKFLEKNFPFTKKLHKNNDLEVYLAEFFYFIGCN